MLADAVFAIGVAGVMIALLGVAVTRANRAERAFAERRSAVRGAETALCELQAARPLPTLEGKTLTIRNLPATSAPAGFRWVEVEAKVGGQRAVLTGIVPSVKGEDHE